MFFLVDMQERQHREEVYSLFLASPRHFLFSTFSPELSIGSSVILFLSVAFFLFGALEYDRSLQEVLAVVFLPCGP